MAISIKLDNKEFEQEDTPRLDFFNDEEKNMTDRVEDLSQPKPYSDDKMVLRTDNLVKK